MTGIAKGYAQPGRQWSRRFNHPYTARKSPPRMVVPLLGCPSAGWAAPWALFNSTVGPVQGLRGYNTPAQGVPASWPGPGTGTIPAQVPPAGQVISIKPDITQVLAGTLDSALAAYFASMPSGAYVTCWHEGEIAAQKLGYTQSQVIAMHTRAYGIFKANAPAASSYGQIVATYSAFSGALGFPLGPWMCTPANGGALLDFYGMDVYPPAATTTFADNIGAAMSAMIAAGVPASGPWTFPEVGAASSTSSVWKGTPSQWLADGFSVAQQLGAIHFFVYFNNSLGSSPLYWPPLDLSTLRVVQDIAAISRGDPRPAAAVTPARSTTAAWVTSTSSSGLTAAFSSNPAAGSKVLVVVQCVGGTATLAVTDNGATPGVFAQDASCLNANNRPSLFVYRADNITLPGSGTYAVSVTLSPTGPLQVAACAYTGLQNGPPSASSAIIGAASSNPALNPVIPADAAGLFFEAFFCNTASSAESITSATPEFTIGPAQVNGSSSYAGAISDAIVSTPAPRAGGWTLPDAPAFGAVMNAYAAFPASITLVPGAEGAWASSPDPDPGITVSAGLASASGAAQPITLGVNAGLAAASGWAAVNQPSSSASPTAGLASASGAAAAAAATVTVTAGLASASGAVPFTPGTTASLTLTAVNPVGAAGAALNATGTVSATPAVSSAAGAALSAAVTASPAPAAAAATGAAGAGTGSAGAAPAAAGATGAAGTGTPNVTATPASAPATGAALNATVTTSGATNASAGLAAAAGAALAPAVTVAPAAAAAPATGTPPAAVATDGTPAGLASASGAALQAGGQNAGRASAAGAALQPSVITGVAPAAATAAATGTALQPAATVTAAAGLPAGTGAAPQPAMANPATATGTGAALQPAGHTTGAAPASGAALQPAVTVAVTAGLAAATGTAVQPAVVTGTAPAAGLAAATGTAQQPAVTVTFTAATAAGTGAGLAAVHGINAGLAAASGTAPTPSLTALAAAAAAQALAAALNPATTSAAAFTVGALSAGQAVPTSALSAGQAVPTSALTASATRTGGSGG